MENNKTMPVCFKREEIKIIEEYARKLGMLSYSQAIEKVVSELNN